MGSTFNPQILVEKLNKLNSSQASIETLSHWCIFHMHKAKQVVETWDRQFHCSPPEQRLAFLYLANDILQNSRRKGSEFVGEFWKVLPGALRDVIENGNEYGRNAARRLINIWDERKVFGSRGQILKEELVGKHLDNRNEKHLSVKMKHPIGNTVDKIVSGYQVVYGSPMDEDVILTKCRNAISAIEKVEKEIGSDIHSEQLHESALVEELQGQHATLRNCIEQLTAKELARASLVSHLREALQEQESKLGHIRNELQSARSHSEQAGNICQQLLAEHNSNEAPTSMGAPGFIPADREQSASVMYTQNLSLSDRSGHIEEGSGKSAAAAVAAKLTSSASSAQMLSYVFSSLASDAVTVNQTKEPAGDLPPEKRSKLEIDRSYTPPHSLQPPLIAPFPHPDSLQNNMATQELTTDTPPPPPPPPPSSPPPLPPLPPMPPYQVPQYMQSSGMPFSYNMTAQPPPTLSGYPSVAPPPLTGIAPFAPPPTNPYPTFQGSDGNFYSQPTSMPMAPISRQ